MPPINLPAPNVVAQFLQGLPRTSPLSRSDLLKPEMRLFADRTLAIYYAPFDHVNRHALLVLVGVTPGWQQTEIAFRKMRDQNEKIESTETQLLNAKLAAGFAGQMRSNLVNMLDSFDLSKILDIPSTSCLFTTRHHLLHATSAIRYPTFRVNGSNYNGTPKVQQHPVLRWFVIEVLAPELSSVPDALIVPMGKPANEAVELLVRHQLIEKERCLFGVPHPSGANNGHRISQLRKDRDQLAHSVRRFFGTSRGDAELQGSS